MDPNVNSSSTILSSQFLDLSNFSKLFIKSTIDMLDSCFIINFGGVFLCFVVIYHVTMNIYYHKSVTDEMLNKWVLSKYRRRQLRFFFISSVMNLIVIRFALRNFYNIIVLFIYVKGYNELLYLNTYYIEMIFLLIYMFYKGSLFREYLNVQTLKYSTTVLAILTCFFFNQSMSNIIFTFLISLIFSIFFSHTGFFFEFVATRMYKVRANIIDWVESSFRHQNKRIDNKVEKLLRFIYEDED